MKEAAQAYLARRIPETKAYGLAQNIKPQTLEDALTVHQEMISLRKDSVAGWKCLLPLADDKLIVAPIFSDTLAKGNQCLIMPDEGKVKVEPEIAFVLNKDLPPQETDYSEAEINAAIGSCHMALELMQKRFAKDANVEFSELLADCLTNQGLYLGPEIDKEKAFSASDIAITIKQIDHSGVAKVKSFEGVHPNPLPQLPLYWAINYMSKRGVHFKEGQAFITGSYAGIVELEFDKATEINYAGLGSFKVTFQQDK